MKHSRLPLLALPIALLFAACGSDDSASTQAALDTLASEATAFVQDMVKIDVFLADTTCQYEIVDSTNQDLFTTKGNAASGSNANKYKLQVKSKNSQLRIKAHVLPDGTIQGVKNPNQNPQAGQTLNFTVRDTLTPPRTTEHKVELWCCVGGGTGNQECRNQVPVGSHVPDSARVHDEGPVPPVVVPGGPVMRVEN